MIKGIFFDVGGTLYSYRSLPGSLAKVLTQLAGRMELEHDVAELVQHYELASKKADKDFATRPAYLFRDYFAGIFDELLTRLGKTDMQHHFEWFDTAHRDIMLAEMTLKPDCHDTLAQLKGRGLYLSAVSNADENQLHPLIVNGRLDQWLTHWTSSEAAQSCKPDRRFFEIALQKSGLAPQEVLFVGDSLEQDILGADAVGMQTVLITEYDAPAPMHIGREVPDPDYRIAQLSELLPILDRIQNAASVADEGRSKN